MSQSGNSTSPFQGLAGFESQAVQDELVRLERMLEEKEFRLMEARERLLRAMADLANLQRRSTQEFLEFREVAVEELVGKFLPVLDHFQEALKQLRSDTSSAEVTPLVAGFKLIYEDFSGTMKKEGVSIQEVIGKPFDPLRHEAVARVERDDYAEGIIVEEVRRGYDLRGRVLRPAMVKVAAKKPDASPP